MRGMLCHCGTDGKCIKSCNCGLCHEVDMNTDTQLVKRIKSFLWRAGMVGLTAAVAWVLANLDLLHLPTWAVGLIGLVLGEVSKYLNSKTQY